MGLGPWYAVFHSSGALVGIVCARPCCLEILLTWIALWGRAKASGEDFCLAVLRVHSEEEIPLHNITVGGERSVLQQIMPRWKRRRR